MRSGWTWARVAGAMMLGCTNAVAAAQDVSAEPEAPPASAERPPPTDPASEPQLPPPGSGDADWQWVRLVTGETFGGDFHGMYDGTLEIDSDEVGRMFFDWVDIAAFYSPEPVTVVTVTRAVHRGPTRMRADGVLRIRSGGREEAVPRGDVLFITPGGEQERDHWYFKVNAGLNLSDATVDAFTVTSSTRIRRRDEHTRLTLKHDLSIGATSSRERRPDPDDPTMEVTETVRTETSNNQWGNLAFDYFVSKALYVTPISATAGYDRLQNIAARVTPVAGAGVHLLDGAQDLDVELGAAYQYTRFVSVEDQDDGTAGQLDTQGGGGGYRIYFDWDPLPDLGLTLETSGFIIYSNQEDADPFDQSNFRASAIVDIDIGSIFDLDITFIWDRVLAPPAEQDGLRPQDTTYTVSVALGIEVGQ